LNQIKLLVKTALEHEHDFICIEVLISVFEAVCSVLHVIWGTKCWHSSVNWVCSLHVSRWWCSLSS